MAVRHIVKYLRARFGIALQSDTAFVENAFIEVLGRPADQDGLDHYRTVLRQGLGRTAVLLQLMRSEEFRRTLATPVPSTLPDLRRLCPEKYQRETDLSNGDEIWTFEATAPADFDWLESAILDNGYYEKPGVWNLGIDADKRVIAEIIAAFSPQRALELGCAAGAVLECLETHGVIAEGVEISARAIARASDRVRARIHPGDLLTIGLEREYDVIFGLDVFEHLNPNRLSAYIARLVHLTRPGGYIFCNIPAFGEDPVFGSVFPLYLQSWAHQEGLFSRIHVDDLGYPIHGHLIWGTAGWWVRQFEAEGLVRQPDIERALHDRYGDYFRKRSPARRAFFVFAKLAQPEESAAIVRRVRLRGGPV